MKTIIIALATLGALSTAAFAEASDGQRYTLIEKWKMQGETSAVQVAAFAVPDSTGLSSFEKAKLRALMEFGPR